MVLLIDGKDIQFHGCRLFVTRDLKCDFCLRAQAPQESPVVSFSTEERTKAAIRVSAQLHVCVKHLWELAEEAEKALAAYEKEHKPKTVRP